jgi:hypothetical protein
MVPIVVVGNGGGVLVAARGVGVSDGKAMENSGVVNELDSEAEVFVPVGMIVFTNEGGVLLSAGVQAANRTVRKRK